MNSDALGLYGLRKAVIIKCGHYALGEINVTSPLFIGGGNNDGKSTFLNALQFLTIDNMEDMVFPSSFSLSQTASFYFGQNPGYLVFDCDTSCGPRTMLIVAKGSLATQQKFDRYLYSGGYEQSDYIDEDGTVRVFEEIKKCLAIKNLSQVSKKLLPSYLTETELKSSHGLRIPILEGLSLSEYKSYKRISKALFSLNNFDGNWIQDTILKIHERQILTRTIDIEEVHKDHFKVLEDKFDQIVKIQSIKDLVEQGLELRKQSLEIHKEIVSSFPHILGDLNYCLEKHTKAYDKAQISKKAIERKILEDEKTLLTSHKESGVLEEKVRQVEDLQKRFLSDKAVFEEYEKNSFKEHKKEKENTLSTLHELKEQLIAVIDIKPELLQKNLKMVQSRIKTTESRLDQKTSTLADWVLEYGIPDRELEAVFSMLQPDLLHRAIDDSFKISSPMKLQEFFQQLGKGYDGTRLKAWGLDVLCSPKSLTEVLEVQELDELEDQLKLDKKEEKRLLSQLDVMKNTEAAQKQKQSLEEYLKPIEAGLHRYEEFKKDEVHRSTSIPKEFEVAHKKWSESNQKSQSLELAIEAAKKSESTLLKELSSIQVERVELTELRRKLIVAKDEYGLCNTVNHEETSLAPVYTKLAEFDIAVQNFMEQKQSADLIKKDLYKLQDGITQIHGVPFSDDQAGHWLWLKSQVENIEKLENSYQSSLNTIMGSVSASFDDILKSCDTVQRAVKKFNGFLRHYRISNLKDVKLTFKQTPLHNLVLGIRDLSSLFSAPDQAERFKEKLSQILMSSDKIHLTDLFQVGISYTDQTDQKKQCQNIEQIGSEGTRLVAKVMILAMFIRTLISDQRIRIPIVVDEILRLDSTNQASLAKMLVDHGLVPIVAGPLASDLEPFRLPTVRAYELNQINNETYASESFSGAAKKDPENEREEVVLNKFHLEMTGESLFE